MRSTSILEGCGRNAVWTADIRHLRSSLPLLQLSNDPLFREQLRHIIRPLG
jgi:hypothetical protein